MSRPAEVSFLVDLVRVVPACLGRAELTKIKRPCYFPKMSKGEETRQMILRIGLDMASELGLEAVTIGALAKRVAMSKSGLFAHFQSKENLQIAILDFAGDLFGEIVMRPALQKPAGLDRIRALLANWIAWSNQLAGGCIFVVAANEFGDRPGVVRDFLVRQQERWHESLSRLAASAVKAGDFQPGIDCDQFAFELYSLMLGFHLYNKLLYSENSAAREQRALEQLLSHYRG